MRKRAQPMDVRVMIVSNPDETCHVSVLAPSPAGRSWGKGYGSKQLCLNELIFVGLLTPTEVAVSRLSDLEKRDSLLVFNRAIEQDVLSAAGYVEQKSDFVN
jgi:hypothetical protein